MSSAPRIPGHPAPLVVRLLPGVAAAAWCAALALLSTWPLGRDLGRVLPLGPYDSPTVTHAMQWTLWWNADRLHHGLDGYFAAPIFAPRTDAFALSEPQPLSGLVFAPLYRASGSLEVAYNVTLLALVSAGGIFAYRLLRRADFHPLAAGFGGGLVVVLPFVHTELGVLPFIALAGVIATLDAWLSFAGSPTWRRAATLGVAVAASYFLSCQLTLLFVVVLAVAGWLAFPRGARLRTVAPRLAVAVAVCGALAGPLVVQQVKTMRDLELHRSGETVRKLSAGVNEYIRSPWPPTFGVSVVPTHTRPRRAFFPGTVKVLLALGAVYVCARRRSWPPIVRVAGGVLVASIVIGTGPLADVGPISIHRALGAVVPGFRQIRGLFHVAAFVQLAVALLAAFSVNELVKRAREGGPRARRWLAAALAMGLLSTFELLPREQRFSTPEPLEAHAGWTGWLRERTPEDAVLAFIPFSPGGTMKDYEPTAKWMRLGAAFQRRMVNGYSSYFPEAHRRLARQAKAFPDAESLRALCAMGVTHVVVDRAEWQGPTSAPELRLAHDDSRAKVTVYVLGCSPAGPSASTTSRHSSGPTR